MRGARCSRLDLPVLVGGVALVRNRRAHRWRSRPFADQPAEPVAADGPVPEARGVLAGMARVGGHVPSTRPRPSVRPRAVGRSGPAYRAGWPIGSALARL